ncbi:MAG TPA: SIMPL domain-containing protein [Vicinamibacterales bacterium]|nr:SIMPL domain-containing protein [Vicinamibacterales bacterium]
MSGYLPLVSFAVVLAAIPAFAQTPSSPEGRVPSVVTTGEGLVQRAPDRAWVAIAAESRASTAQEAQRANTDAMNAVTQKVKSAGVPDDAIRTTAYQLQPEYDFTDGKQRLRDYLARNEIEVKVDDLPKLGHVLGVAVEAGATNVTGIRFDLKDRDAAEREALRLAVADARARADAAAAGAGLHVDRVLRIEEQRAARVPGPRPMAMSSGGFAARAAAPVPVEAGQIEIRAQVTLTAAIR